MNLNNTKRIPSLDGLRAFCILIVIFCHSSVQNPWWDYLPGFLRRFGGNGATGVTFFFVLSGFLISRLLVSDLQKYGLIRLKTFYLRRAFRILPPLYFYLLTMLILKLCGFISFPNSAFFLGAFFGLDYFPGTGAWHLAHLWSLAVEEQFYLTWPFILNFLGLKKSSWLALFVIFFSPLLRIFSLKFGLSTNQVIWMFHTRMDAFMFGSVLALCWSNPTFQKLLNKLYQFKIHYFAFAYILELGPAITQRLGGDYFIGFGMSLQTLAMTVLLALVVYQPSSLIGRCLNFRLFSYIGTLSYSLYLWQQPFMSASHPPLYGTFPWTLIFMLVSAMISHYCIEKPFLKMRERRRQKLNSIPNLPLQIST